MKWGLIVLAMALSGCASSVMGGFVGKPVEAVAVRYGPPVNVFDMPDGRRAFQWNINSTIPLAGYSNTTATIYAPPGGLATVNSSTNYMPAQQIQHSCLYTMYGTYQGNAWVLTGYEKPSLMCE